MKHLLAAASLAILALPGLPSCSSNPSRPAAERFDPGLWAMTMEDLALIVESFIIAEPALEEELAELHRCMVLAATTLRSIDAGTAPGTTLEEQINSVLDAVAVLMPSLENDPEKQAKIRLVRALAHLILNRAGL